ncbi:MAG: glycosyltransferase [Cyanobacteria bacterium]|nr:glycosyltransferase [Cyanobacteriota bacterium]MDW8200101.1 glycosyltransferase family 2 protein [Cyanobacteriota bacterium SKYGB_h_bin112]
MGTVIMEIAIVGLLASLAAIAWFGYRLRQSMAAAPHLEPATIALTPCTLTVIIPAYNEELNLQNCVQSVLASDLPPTVELSVWIADDESTDQTAIIAQALAATDTRLHVLTVPPRPTQELWRGKNWACAQAANQATGDYVLFMDADVRLAPGAIAAALAESQSYQIDLLSCAPEIICGCFAEWLVQPLMMGLLAVGFRFDAVNDPSDPTAFAAGPFMLFRRQAYAAIGGHRAVAAEVVEDVELARRIKRQGYRLRYVLALGLVQVRMYRSFAALWEGWTKNLYLGAQRSIAAMFLIAVAMALLYVFPWLALTSIPVLAWHPSRVSHPLLLFTAVGLLVLTLAAQYGLRCYCAHLFHQPLYYWWLSWLGGGIVMAMAIASVIKTETGWGWTWRGRSLAT